MSQLACSVLLIFVECPSSRAHFCTFLLSEVPPASSRPKKLVINSILLVFNMVSSGPPSLGFPPSFPCRCRFLRMSQLACSFLLICVECLSSRAHFCCRCSFLRMSELACSFLSLCVECLSSRANFSGFPLNVLARVLIS